MLITKKMLIALTLVGALVGAGIGSLLTYSSSNTQAANDRYANIPASAANTNSPEQVEAANASQYTTTAEQAAYRQGFEEGFGTCDSARNNGRRTRKRSSYNSRSRSSPA